MKRTFHCQFFSHACLFLLVHQHLQLVLEAGFTPLSDSLYLPLLVVLITCAVGIIRTGLLDRGIIQHLLTDLFAFVKAQDFTSFIWQCYINQRRILSVMKYKKGRSLTAGKQQTCARAHYEILCCVLCLSTKLNIQEQVLQVQGYLCSGATIWHMALVCQECQIILQRPEDKAATDQWTFLACKQLKMVLPQLNTLE